MIDHEQGAGWNSSVDVDDTTTPPHQLVIWSLGSLSSSTGPITVLTVMKCRMHAQSVHVNGVKLHTINYHT